MGDRQIGGNRGRAVQVRSVRVDGWTRKTREAFLIGLAQTCNVTLAAKRAGKPKDGAYRLKARDETFAALWQEALTAGYERLRRRCSTAR